MTKNNIFNKLFVLEMANNHMGSLSHGISIINAFRKVANNFPDFNFGFKFQYRDLDTFIHPDYKNRIDIKYIKRFSETRLSEEEFKILKNEVDIQNFKSICTPFDESSVDLIEKHKFDILKIASASFTDWNLLERIAKTDLPILISTAGASLPDIDKVVSFFEHRNKEFTLMHCVGEYPTLQNHYELNQIDFFAKRYPNISIGYSTHENPNDFTPIKLAIAKGATVFERHVGLPLPQYPLNAYSSSPEQIQTWLSSARSAFEMCGVKDQRRSCSETELNDLIGLRRGVFAKTIISPGDKITTDNTYFAIPNFPDHLLANDLSKYMLYTANSLILPDQPILKNIITSKNLRQHVLSAIKSISKIIIDSKIALPNKVELELSHHYGIENFEKTGAAIINCINRDYCKKLIVMLPHQSHPSHYHAKKEETFYILHGDITITLNDIEKTYHPGEIITVYRNVSHSFSSTNGGIFEEISTTHFKDDSFYADSNVSKDRKTAMTFWNDWLKSPIK